MKKHVCDVFETCLENYPRNPFLLQALSLLLKKKRDKRTRCVKSFDSVF